MATRYRLHGRVRASQKAYRCLLPFPHIHRKPSAFRLQRRGLAAEPRDVLAHTGPQPGRGIWSGGSAEVDAGDAGGGQAQRGASGVGEASHSNTRSAIALSLLLSDAYQVSTSGEISTVQRGLSTGRVSHERYIAFTRYASDRLPDRRRRPARSWRQRQVPNRGSTGSARKAPGWSRAYVPIAHVAFTRHDAK